MPRLMAAASSPGQAFADAEAEAATGQAQPGSGSAGGSTSALQPAGLDADNGSPAAAVHPSPSLPSYLRRWNALREAALAGARSLQQALPMQPRFVHFGNFCILTQLTSAGQVDEVEESAEVHAIPER